jgi:hypothetical protein
MTTIENRARDCAEYRWEKHAGDDSIWGAKGGAIIVADAMHTQRTFSNQIMEAGADFVCPVKDNQSRTRWEI